MFVCASVHPQKVSSISIKFGMLVEVRVMHNGIQYDPIKINVTSPSKLEIRPFSKAISSAIYNGSWQLTTDS